MTQMSMKPVPPRPLARPDVQGPVPVYTAEEVAEILALLSPLKVCCPGCERWIDVRATLQGLRDYRSWYVDRIADMQFEAWRAHPAVQQVAKEEAAWAEEQAAEAREKTQRETRRQQRADDLLQQLIAWGVPIREAQAEVVKRFGDTA